MLVSKAVFAKRAGVSRPAVTNACKRGGALFEAMCGKQIDTKTDAARRYINKRGLETDAVFPEGGGSAALAAGPEATSAQPEFIPDGTPPPGDTNPEDFENMTLAQLCAIFGTDDRFKVWTIARKVLTDIRKNEIANARAMGTLVNRDLVKRGIIEPIDSAHIKILTDGAKTIARRATALHDAGEPIEEIEKYVSDTLTSFIRPVKAKVAKALRNA